MSGLLSVHPLAELINEISRARLSGVLRLSRARARGAVYFDSGQVANALVNLRAYRLVEALRRSGAVDAETVSATIKQNMPDDAAGAALVAAGLLTSDELRRFRQKLAAEVLRQLLTWTDGEWSFDPRVRLAEGPQVQVDVDALLIESARRLSAEFAAKSFYDLAEKLSPTREATLEVVPLLPAEAFVLSRFDAPLSLGDLGAVSGLPEDETRRAAYVLVLAGLLRRERPPRALSNVVITAPGASASARSATSKTAGPTKSSEIAEENVTDAPPDHAKDPREELAELFARAERATFYEILGVNQLVRPEEIKSAYYALARRFHPDRFRHHTDASELPRVELSFAKIAQAHDVLRDPARRAAYDLKLSAVRTPRATPSVPRAAGESSNPQTNSRAEDLLRRAEETFQQGLTALRQDDFAQASKCFREAALLVPQQARYRAYFGRLLAREKTTRRQAEAELQAAVALDARNVTYRVMLAELYRDVGMRRRAQSELEQALSIDRGHDAARRLLDEIRRGG